MFRYEVSIPISHIIDFPLSEFLTKPAALTVRLFLLRWATHIIAIVLVPLC